MKVRSTILLATTLQQITSITARRSSSSSRTRTSLAFVASPRFAPALSKSLTTCKMSTDATPPAAEPRKAGVASPSELQTHVSTAGTNLLIIDVRHPDPAVEPGDAKSLAVAGFPDKETNYRPLAVNLPWSRETNDMPLPKEVLERSRDTHIITHCGGGGRGQKAKEYLEGMGFTNVLNGGGPKETECWAVYGEK